MKNALIRIIQFLTFHSSTTLTACFSLFTFHCSAQLSIRDSAIAFPMIGASFQYQMPAGDMADRFNNNFNVGALFQYKFKSNWLVGVEGNFLFAENINDQTILSGITASQGYIIGSDGQPADVILQERGWLIYAKGGKIFNFIGPNPNSGLLATLGVGLLQHKVRFETKDDISELDEDYQKGYDKLTNGLSLTQFIGYIHFGNSRLINFYAGFEITEAFTQDRRSFDFNLMKKDDTKRLDVLLGAKVGWFFPLYKHAATSYYYN